MGEIGFIKLYIPKPNFVLDFGNGSFKIEFRVKRTIKNRIKWWLFCRFFPAETRWLEE